MLSSQSSTYNPPIDSILFLDFLIQRVRSRKGRLSQITADGEKVGTKAMSIYSDLIKVEAKCTEDGAKSAASQRGCPLTGEHWQELISLHQSLLHEHHDFYLASWHPSASQGLKGLAAAMPNRLAFVLS